MVMAICYEIWWSRNKRCFEGIEIPCAVRCCNKALKNVHNFNYAHNVVVQIQYHPILYRSQTSDGVRVQPGCYKLNVDAAGPSADRNWGLAAIIRDVEGVVLAVACWYMPILTDSNVAEALALMKGIEFSKDMLFLHLCAESDSSNVISAIKDNQPVSPYVDTIIEDCIRVSFYIQKKVKT